MTIRADGRTETEAQRAEGTVDDAGTQTQTQTHTETVTDTDTDTRPRVQWAEDVVDNEGMGKKKSKSESRTDRPSFYFARRKMGFR